jgi:adenylosuccinate synthase
MYRAIRGAWQAAGSRVGAYASGNGSKAPLVVLFTGLAAGAVIGLSHAEPKKGAIDVVLGAQWGDEGKGKLVDILAADYDICARVAGGSNAGHTIVVGGKKYKFHLVPSCILNKQSHCVVGHGVVVHLRGLLQELRSLDAAGVDYTGRLHLSDRAHIVFDFHQQVDGINEARLGGDKLGTTKKGIGPAYGSKIQRNGATSVKSCRDYYVTAVHFCVSGLRIGDLRDMVYFEAKLRTLIKHLKIAYPDLEVDADDELAYYQSIREEVLSMTTDTISMVHAALKADKTVLVEGANATMIDIDFGTYPFVTSSNPSVGSACTGLGVPPGKVANVTGIVKAYCTRVGEGCDSDMRLCLCQC